MSLTSRNIEVLEVIKLHAPITLKNLSEQLAISKKNLYIHIHKLLSEEKIEKIGTPPKVYYFLKTSQNKPILKTKSDLIIENNYIFVDANGEMKRGLAAFDFWCDKNNLDLNANKKEYIKSINETERLRGKDTHLLSGIKSIFSNGKSEINLDNIYFSDFYTLGHFGKTKLGQLIYLAKPTGNIKLIKEIIGIIQIDFKRLLKKYNFKYVAFIPPTIVRKVQFNDVLRDNLKLKLIEIKLDKIIIENRIAQKTLRKLEDRIRNARTTIAIKNFYKIDGNVLLIDDVTGSGATLNEVAKKIKVYAINKDIKVIGYTIVGSKKGFDVISEV